MSSLKDVKDFDDVILSEMGRVQHCMDNSVNLNSWEDDFLENILNTFLLKGIHLTEPQKEKLEEIEYIVEWGRDSFHEEYGFRQ